MTPPFSDAHLHTLAISEDPVVAALAVGWLAERETAARVDHFLLAVKAEHRRARTKFPSPEGLNAALMEEVGELSKAQKEEPWPNVYAEATQVASTAMRIALEGDPTQNGVRVTRGQHPGPTFKGVLPIAPEGEVTHGE